jgi:flavin-dependent dehydrogenase
MLAPSAKEGSSHLCLEDGARVAVIGGGPAGSLFCFFLLRMAHQIDLNIHVDMYEPRHFTHNGTAGCNHCGGIVSESLVQLLAAEGVNIPAEVIQRGIDSYMLHMDVGQVRIDTPTREKRIAAVFRGNGPASSESTSISGFDEYLQKLAIQRGTQLIPKLVTGLDLEDHSATVTCADGFKGSYDLLVMATGINSQLVQMIEDLEFGYHPPEKTKTFICEFQLGRDAIEQYLGTSMHVFLLDISRLEFAALIPKGDFVTACLLGHDIDEELIESFFNSAEVRKCFPYNFVPNNVCHCFPRLNVKGSPIPYADRLVLIGECGITRLYKDGIGAAFRTAKAAASTVALHGIAAVDFEKHFWPTCKKLNFDNRIGHLIFAITHKIQRIPFLRRTVLRMTRLEQLHRNRKPHMSTALWDVFTGSAPYKEVLTRAFHPTFILNLILNLCIASWFPVNNSTEEHTTNVQHNIR